MGHPYTSKFVLFDQTQWDIPLATSLEEQKSGLCDLISDEIAPYDDLDDCSLGHGWIASERLNCSTNLPSVNQVIGSNQDADWTSSLSKVLSACMGLPDFLIDAYNASGSMAEIKDWLSTSLETGASYRRGLNDIH